MLPLEKLKREFLEYLEIERGHSLKTIENYQRYLDRFFSFAEIESPEDITDDLVRKFRLYLNRQKGVSDLLKKNTQNYYLIALRAFLKYLIKRGIKSLAPERIELAKLPERDLDLISLAELERLLNAPAGNDLKALRDRAILELLFSTGLRVSELVALNRDIDLNKDELTIRGKGGKVRLVFLSAQAKKAIKDYLAKREDLAEPLFIQLKRKEATRLTTRSIERIVKFYASAAGISKKVTVHTLRHCFATDLLQNGADIRSVQMLLGHANVATTQIYTHLTDRHLKEIHKKFHRRKN